MRKIGLTLGKFAPLHRGHQLLIETALSEVDHVIVVVYDAPDVTRCPLPLRANWIRQLYPQVEVLEAWDGPTMTGDTPEIKQLHEQFLKKLLENRRITHFYSSEFYGDHVSRALGALDRCIDPERRQVPISGTDIRADPYGCRHFIDPVVYRDLVIRIVFVGAPCTGKTTLARELAKLHQTAWMPEFGREYWEKHQQNRRLSPKQLVEIAEGHRLRENELVLDANRYLFVDTDATTTYMFSMHYHAATLPRLAELAAQTLCRYDIHFLCEDDFPYSETWDRSGEAQREVFQKQIRADLMARGIPFVRLCGGLTERMNKVGRLLAGFEKYQSFAEHLARAMDPSQGSS